MASSSQSPAGGGSQLPASGKPVVQPLTAGGVFPQSGGNLASMFGSNQGYGGGGSGVTVPQITQPTSGSLGLPDITKMLQPPRQPVAPAAPTTRAPSGQEIQQRISQMQPNGGTQVYSQNGGVNAMDANSGGKAQRFADYYYRLKYQNPDMAAQVLERSPYKSIFSPVQVAQPQQPYQPSQAALTARRTNNERP